MSAEQNKAIVRRVFEEGYGQGNEATIDELIAPDFILRTAWGGWQDPESRGPEYVKDLVKYWRAALSDIFIDIEQMIAEGDKVATVASFGGKQEGDVETPFGAIKATGKMIKQPVIRVSRVFEGKIVEEWESANFGSIWLQLGAIPSPQS